MAKEDKRSVPGEGLDAWLKSDEVGCSSKYMASVLTRGRRIQVEQAHPSDPGDFVRCRKLLLAVPEFNGRLATMAEKSEVWCNLVSSWDRLCALLEEEAPEWKNGLGSAPKTARQLKIWVTKIPSTDNSPLFPNRFGRPLTRSGVRQRLLVAQQQATKHCPSLSERRITPHTLRHTTAMHLLQSGVDLSVIALWLGHEQIGTTHQYMEANLARKKAALKSLDPIKSGSVERFKKPSDSVLVFLESL